MEVLCLITFKSPVFLKQPLPPHWMDLIHHPLHNVLLHFSSKNSCTSAPFEELVQMLSCGRTRNSLAHKATSGLADTSLAFVRTWRDSSNQPKLYLSLHGQCTEKSLLSRDFSCIKRMGHHPERSNLLRGLESQWTKHPLILGDTTYFLAEKCLLVCLIDYVPSSEYRFLMAT